MIEPTDHEPTPSDEYPLAFDHVMIDIETMSLHPHKALILSVGMIEFDPTSLAGLRTGAKKLIILNLEEQLALGRRVDVGTQKFWAEQSSDARWHWLNSDPAARVKTYNAMNDVHQFCDGRGRVWANGTQFDLSNLVGLAEDAKYTDPLWHYQSPRDMRTFCRENPQTRISPIGNAIDIPGVAHEPIYDCMSQALQVWCHWRNE